MLATGTEVESSQKEAKEKPRARTPPTREATPEQKKMEGNQTASTTTPLSTASVAPASPAPASLAPASPAPATDDATEDWRLVAAVRPDAEGSSSSPRQSSGSEAWSWEPVSQDGEFGSCEAMSERSWNVLTAEASTSRDPSPRDSSSRQFLPEDILGEWVDSLGHQIIVTMTDAAKVYLAAKLSKPNREPKVLWIRKDKDAGWIAGNGRLDPSRSSPSRIFWQTGDGSGRNSLWIRTSAPPDQVFPEACHEYEAQVPQVPYARSGTSWGPYSWEDATAWWKGGKGRGHIRSH